jgi:hypothetical protein
MNRFVSLLALGSVLAAAGCSSDDRRASVATGASAASTPASAVPRPASDSIRDAATSRRFGSVPDRGELFAYPSTPVVRKDGAYTWHRADLSESHARRAIGGVLSLRTPSGEQVQFRYERHVDHPNGDWTWIGSVVGKQIEEAIITFGPKAAFGTIAQPGREPLRLTIRDGVSWLVETDPRQIAALANVGSRPAKPDFLVAPELVANAVASSMSASAAKAAGDGAIAASTTVNGVTRVDVLLGYTPGFVDSYGGQSQALTRLNNLVDITNEAYVNSGMPTQVRLVKTLLVNYTDANANGTALEELTGFKAPSTQTTPNPIFSELRAAREQYGADLVSLVRRFNTPENDGCGIAWLIGGGRRNTISASSEFFGYSVVSDGRDTGTDGKTYFCRDETLAHEFGHNMGSAHDRDTSDGEDNILQTNEYGVFDYSFGYKTGSAQGNFFTVMAYGDSGQARYRVFSNPRITFCGGLACGAEGTADNARSITTTFPSIAAFRAEVASEPPAPTPTKPAVRDLNLDGRSDIVLHNVNSGELYAWLMNGSTIGAQQGNAFLPIGHTAIGSGDFNGDGRVDIVSASSADVRISYGQSTGFGTTSVVANRPPGVWAFAGATDVNADGKTDMIWHHRGSGELYYWLMNGSTIIGGNGNAYLPIGHVAIATADFDGDGRGDVLSANSTDVRISFARASGTYTAPSIVANRPAVGWAFAGAGDVNNDGRADVVWHNVNSGEIYYWLMQGATVSSGQGASFLPAGFAAVTLGDFNGDGRADIVAASPTETRVSLAQATSGFATPTLINPRPFAGWKFVDDVERNRTSPFNDVDADGRSDIIWHNSVSGELYYWLMSGSSVAYERGATFMPAGFTSIATADFNTDGRVDIVSTNGSELRLSLALPAGGFGPATVVANRPPSSWAFGGVGDIDADGRGDILWHNTISGELYYWLMSGASIVGGQGGALVPIGHEVIGLGDFNGDGQADVMSANASEMHVSMALASGSFGPSIGFASRPAGWTFAGIADINADTRSDVLWHNANSGEVYYWAMTGASASSVVGSVALPVGHSVLALGDFNRDGRADVLAGNAADVRISLALQSGAFGPPALVRARPPSTWLFVAPH